MHYYGWCHQTVILAANTERRAWDNEGNKLVKEFVLKYPGIYRFKFEVRSYSSSDTGSATVSVNGERVHTISISTYDWKAKSLEISTGLYGSVVRVRLEATSSYVYIRNVKICGTITMAEPPGYAVLQN